MTLRFFRRKTGTPDAAAGDGAAPEETNDSEASPKRTTRRRGSSTSRAKKTTTEERTTTTQPTKSTSRTRRGRRGGVGRNSKAKAEAAAKAAERPEEVEQETLKTRSRGRSTSASRDGTTIETILQKQEAALDQQLTVMKGLQGSLSAIEHRLGGDRPGAPVDQARVGIFVDVPNIMYAAERLRVKLDYGRMLNFILRGRELMRASAYAPISDDPQAKLETQKFVEPFVDLGYRVVTKPLKRFADGSMKGNFDVELAIDVLTMSDRLDIVSLVSGDGDFRRLVEIVQSKGVRVEVIAFGQSTAAELRQVADEYVDLQDHLKELKAPR